MDPSEKANLVVRDVVVDEKAGIATFDLVLDRAASAAFTVAYATATNPGTATAGSDFTAASGTLGFAAGQTVQHVTVAITDDVLAEGLEFFNLTLGAVSGDGAGEVQIGDGLGMALIGNSDRPVVATPMITCTPLVVSEADGYAEFIVTLTAPSASLVSVGYATGNGTADSWNQVDFTAVGGTLKFAPGVTTQTLRVPLTNDSSSESLESFYLQLTNPVGVTLASDRVWATIADNDRIVADSNGDGVLNAAEKANLAVRDVVVDEKAGIATFDLVLDRAASAAFSVGYSTATNPGTATAGSDFTAASGTLGFAAGQTVQHVTVAITDDALAEGPEFFNLTLGALAGDGVGEVQIGDGLGMALIGNSDRPVIATPMITCTPLAVSEADGYAEFTVTLSAPSASLVSLGYSTGDGTADSWNQVDFTAVGGTLKFAPGVTTQTLRVPLTNNSASESLESFYLQFSNPVGATLASDRVWATIADNDWIVADSNGDGVLNAAEKANLAVRDVVVDEKAGIATFDLVLDRAATAAFTVAYSTATRPGTATAGTDFTAESGTLGFATGQTVQHVTVAVTDDALAEGPEFFNLTLGAVSGAGRGEVQILDGVGAAVIGGSDRASVASPALSILDSTVVEDAGYADLLVQLSAPSTNLVAVNYRSAAGTASSFYNSDFVGVAGTLKFAPGETIRTIRVPIVQDSRVEAQFETFSVTLSGAAGGTISRATATVSLADTNDPDHFNPMAYGWGSDVYVVDGANDRVLEATNGGTDLVKSSIAYTLPAEVEQLTLTGTAAIGGTGNALNNVLIGNNANNTLSGLNGNDTLAGGAGSDTLDGGAGNDLLTGGSGSDTLTGGAGADRFKFVTTGDGLDRITDFVSGVDKLLVVSANFGQLPVGALAADRLVTAATPMTNGNAVFIYNGSTGALGFDRDGNGAAAPVQIATLSARGVLAAGDIQVVAA